MELTLSASLEDYLEAIYHIISEKQAAKAKDIAQRLKVGPSSVTGALHQLAERKLINYSPYDLITLTAMGKTVAAQVVERHTVLKDFFTKVLDVDPKAAEAAACQMEHAITGDILERFTHFIQFVDTCPRAGTKWIHGFGYLCDSAADKENCRSCIQQSLNDLEDKIKEGANDMKETTSLANLKPGQKGKIVSATLDKDAARRFAEMGLTEGTVLNVERIAPLGDPVEISVRGYRLSLRQQDIRNIQVALVEE